jgi:glutamine synthetase
MRLRAADDAWLFKMLVKGLARRHGFAASFMAKPYLEYSGSGLHTHFSGAG